MPRVMNNNDLESIKNSISRYLSMREHSKQELVDKLLKKDYEKDLIMQCIEEFSDKDLQSDYRYAESFVRAKFNDLGMGVAERLIISTSSFKDLIFSF